MAFVFGADPLRASEQGFQLLRFDSGITHNASQQFRVENLLGVEWDGDASTSSILNRFCGFHSAELTGIPAFRALR
jgi:hypothetical protein